MSRPRENCDRVVALEYRPAADQAPIVTLNEAGPLKNEILKIARRYGVPIVEKPHLATALAPLPVGTAIPERLYEAVARLICEIEKRTRAEGR